MMDDDEGDNDGMGALVSVISFVPRGAMQAVPDRYEPHGNEYEQLIERSNQLSLKDVAQHADMTEFDELDEESDMKDGDMADNDDNDEDDDVEEMSEKQRSMSSKDKADAFMAELDMDAYDEEESGATMLLGGRNLAVFQSNTDDPYITMPDGADSSDEEHNVITDKDTVFFAGRTEEEHSVMEIYVYDEIEGGLYVHHDFAIPSFPLSSVWMSNCFNEHKGGSFIAIGTFEPGIEIWNLDVMDVMEPITILGGLSPETKEIDQPPIAESSKPMTKSQKKQAKKKAKKRAAKAAAQISFMPGSHESAVLALDWHHAHPNILASGSADQTIKLWDVSTSQCGVTLAGIHSDKVQALKFNAAEPSVLLSGGFDRVVALTDVRAPETAVQNAIKWTLDNDIEALSWNPTQPFQFFATTDAGMVYCFDARKPQDPPLFRLAAHNQAVSNVTIDAALPNLLCTSSVDGVVKLWNIKENTPKLHLSKEMNLGPILSMHMQEMQLVCGGNQGKVGLWDLREDLTPYLAAEAREAKTN